MHFVDWILVALLVLAAFFAVRAMVRQRKRGGCAGCSGCGCAECARAADCKEKDKNM